MAYDEVNDYPLRLLGHCCDARTVLPTVFRLVRDVSGVFQVESYQPLRGVERLHRFGVEPRADRKLYVAKGQELRTYDYLDEHHRAGRAGHRTLTGILGLNFSDDGARPLRRHERGDGSSAWIGPRRRSSPAGRST